IDPPGVQLQSIEAVKTEEIPSLQSGLIDWEVVLYASID
ncbi:hypothetical protein A2U01_0093880, partial [Trifolium medium]|nr:hypothetical protein [Trifolium medium]